jgi:hypothetical protein
MKAGNFLVAGALFCSLGLTTACSVAKDVKNANNMEKEGNAIVASVNQEKSALSSEGVYVDIPSMHKYNDWEKKTPEKRAELRVRLNKMVMQLYRYLEIAKHKDMRASGGTVKAETVQEGAMNILILWISSKAKLRRTKNLRFKR